jgi:hypothetical protein
MCESATYVIDRTFEIGACVCSSSVFVRDPVEMDRVGCFCSSAVSSSLPSAISPIACVTCDVVSSCEKLART